MLKEPVKLGAYYRCRDGVVVGPMEATNRVDYSWRAKHQQITRTWDTFGNHTRGHIKCFDLIEEVNSDGSPIRNEAERLTEQTIDTFAKIARNGGKVPDGFEGEGLCEDGSWTKLIQPAAFFFGNNYRLTPIPQPPRFSVSTDPIGVLDSQRPGMIAKFKNALDAAKFVVDKLNRGERVAGDYEWKPIAHEMVPLDLLDAPPGSVFSYAPEQGWFPAMCNQHGIVFNGSCIKWKELKEKNCFILRPGQTEWAKCEKVKP